MTEKERMLQGKLYLASDPVLFADYNKARKITRLYNATTEEQLHYRKELLQGLLGKIGTKLHIEPPFRCDYGCHISVGENFYANYDCIIIDVCQVSIGDNVFFGPRVSLYTAGHPLDPLVRNTLLEFGKPISIGDNCWLGGNTVVLPGVSIGNNTVIGAGSVVTKNIPDNVVAVGNPCRIRRVIDEREANYWREQKKEYFQN